MGEGERGSTTAGSKASYRTTFPENLEAVFVSVRPQDEPGANAPLAEELHGKPGTVLSEGADESGRWLVRAEWEKLHFRVRAPAWALLWRGAEVLLEGQPAVVARGRPDAATAQWRVAVRKQLSVKPANAAAAEGSAQVKTGSLVRLSGLVAKAEYNGQFARVSSGPSAAGRLGVLLEAPLPMMAYGRRLVTYLLFALSR